MIKKKTWYYFVNRLFLIRKIWQDDRKNERSDDHDTMTRIWRNLNVGQSQDTMMNEMNQIWCKRWIWKFKFLSLWHYPNFSHARIKWLNNFATYTQLDHQIFTVVISNFRLKMRTTLLRAISDRSSSDSLNSFRAIEYSSIRGSEVRWKNIGSSVESDTNIPRLKNFGKGLSGSFRNKKLLLVGDTARPIWSR